MFVINDFTTAKWPQQRYSTVTHRLTHRFYSQGQSQRTLNICRIHSNTTNRMQNSSSQYTQHTPHHHQKTLLCLFSLILLCFPWDHVVSEAQLMNSGQLVGLKFIDRTATSQPAFLPGCVALIVQSVRSICYWAALLAWQHRAGSITSIAWWLRREQWGHAC